MPLTDAEATTAPDRPRAAYVHVPFCAHHCGYCDFAVAVGQDHQIDLYLEALAVELATLGAPQAADTLFLGGGTPTHLDACRLDRLLTAVCQWLPLAPGGEFSVGGAGMIQLPPFMFADTYQSVVTFSVA